MSPIKVKKLTSIFTANGGCGCGCNSTAATDIIEPKPKSRIFYDQKLVAGHCPSSSDSSWMRYDGGRNSAIDDEDYTSTTFSITSPGAGGHCCTPEHHATKTIIHSYGKIQGSSAVIKASDNPYRDFRHSMLQMIFENEIYSRNDLKQLLDCFLRLNSPHHQEIIIRAFMEIWNGGIGGERGE